MGRYAGHISRVHVLRRKRDHLTTSRVSRHTRLIQTLLKVLTTHVLFRAFFLLTSATHINDIHDTNRGRTAWWGFEQKTCCTRISYR